jgi:zinc transporter
MTRERQAPRDLSAIPPGVKSVRDVRDVLLSGTGPRTAGEFLVLLTTRLSSRIQAAVENIENLIDELEQNARMYLLSVVAAIFLPLTFVTGLLGMNVAGLPGTESPSGFIISAVVMVVLGIELIGYFKWRKWI